MILETDRISCELLRRSGECKEDDKMTVKTVGITRCTNKKQRTWKEMNGVICERRSSMVTEEVREDAERNEESPFLPFLSREEDDDELLAEEEEEVFALAPLPTLFPVSSPPILNCSRRAIATAPASSFASISLRSSRSVGSFASLSLLVRHPFSSSSVSKSIATDAAFAAAADDDVVEESVIDMEWGCERDCE